MNLAEMNDYGVFDGKMGEYETYHSDGGGFVSYTRLPRSRPLRSVILRTGIMSETSLTPNILFNKYPRVLNHKAEYS